MRVVVTGAAGFVGSHLCEELLLAGHDVTGIDSFDPFYERSVKERNLRTALSAAHFDLVEGDVRDDALVRDVVSDAEAVFHLAARPGVRASFDDPDLYRDVNAGATESLLRICGEASVERLVFASSSSVYGAGPTPPFREDEEIGEPLSPYAASKQEAEKVCVAATDVIPIIAIIRIFTSYGPRQRPDLAISKFVALMKQGRPLPLYDGGRGSRDFTYVTDLAVGLRACLALTRGAHIINIGSGGSVSVATVVSELERCMGTKALIESLPPERGDMPATQADISRARALLGFEPATPFAEGIAAFIEWTAAEESA